MEHGTGYAVEAVKPEEFKVRFQGNGNTSPEQVSDFALLRAAEICQQHGFCCFAVIDVINNSSVRPYTRHRVEYAGTYPDWSPGLSYAPFSGPPPSFGVEEPALYVRPGVTLEVRCFKEKPEKPFTYNAAALEAQLRRKYELRQ
jgi:hypothetical protein